MSIPKTKTYNIPAGSGDVIDMGRDMSSLRAFISDASASTADVWVRAQRGLTSAPSAPVATPAPADGAEGEDGWVHLKGPGSSTPTWTGEFESFRYVEIWGIADGELTVSA